MTASVAAQDAQIGQVIYGSAKAGVNGLVLPMARDLMDIGIRVNSIMPGIFATPLMLGATPKVLDRTGGVRAVSQTPGQSRKSSAAWCLS